MNFNEQLDSLLSGHKEKDAIKKLIDHQLLKAYRIGWNHCLIGDDVRSVDYLSEMEILQRLRKGVIDL